MQVRILLTGKRQDGDFSDWMEKYSQRARASLVIQRLYFKSRAQMLERAQAPYFLLDERGKTYSSVDFAKWLGAHREDGVRSIDFLIGDAEGFTDTERRQAQGLLSLSKMTLPHRMAQLILCEQLYRAATIWTGHPYHKE